MALWHLRSKRKPSGGRLHKARKKRRVDRGNLPIETRVGARQVSRKRVEGGKIKLKLSAVEKINVADPKTGKITRVKVLSVKDNKANVHYIRRNIVTKGAVVETEAGLARVTSRPGQQGIANAVLIEAKK
ncbi:MAG: 30S ribosomal protein S8e [Candidatus Aenigmatarchaeota archaeon]|nr:MAG: 30S ribosomal protein S8e [Candidatus Aenigmarchaeota archaeon]